MADTINVSTATLLSLLGQNQSQGQSSTDSIDFGKCIVVAQRGYVLIGNTRRDGEFFNITDCSCIRRWGTTKGLGQLASEGPTSDTVLDPQPTTTIHQLAVVQVIRCTQ